MKVLILAPRLDVPFKDFGIALPEERGPITGLRVHWANFVNSLAKRHKLAGDQVKVIEKPLYEFTTRDISDAAPDLAYVPHRDMHTWHEPVDRAWKTMFWHQSVFPWLFTIDPWGWGASMSADIRPMLPPGKGYETLKAWVAGKNSKFDQPTSPRVRVRGEYAFFPLQLPHDETIRLHSSVSVEDAMLATLRWCARTGRSLVIKEHPANPGSMIPLKEAFDREKLKCDARPVWLMANDCSIHDLLPNCEAVFCVNSGVGMEALVYGKPVFLFGSAEYSPVATTVTVDDINAGWEAPRPDPEHVKSWLETYVNFCYDTTAEP